MVSICFPSVAELLEVELAAKLVLDTLSVCGLASGERSKKSMPRSAKIRLKRWPSFASHSSRL